MNAEQKAARRERLANERELRRLRFKVQSGSCGRNAGATLSAYERRRRRHVELIDRERELAR